jgi:hypothetical protein
MKRLNTTFANVLLLITFIPACTLIIKFNVWIIDASDPDYNVSIGIFSTILVCIAWGFMLESVNSKKIGGK